VTKAEVILLLCLTLSWLSGCDDSPGGGDAGLDADATAGGDDGGFDAGSDPGADPGADPGLDAGSDPGSDPGADPGADPGPQACRVFPEDNPWNTDISGYPVHPNSGTYIASIGTGEGLHPDFGTEWMGAPNGIPYDRVEPDVPKFEVIFEHAPESDPGPYPIPENPSIEGGPDGDGDRHMLMLDETDCMLYELFYAWPPGQGPNPSQDTWYAGSGAIFDLASNDLRPDTYTSADAAGLPIFPGLVRYEEAVEQGEIRHALRFTVSQTQRGFIHPATHFASSDTNPDLPPMGLRLRLKADYDVSGFSPEVQVILQALKKYGMFVADNGSDWFISGAPHPSWNDDHLHELTQVPGSAFEAVDTGPIIQ